MTTTPPRVPMTSIQSVSGVVESREALMTVPLRKASRIVVMSLANCWPGMTVITVATAIEADVLETALPVVEDTGNPKPEVEVKPGIALLTMLDTRAGIEEDSIAADEVPSTGDDAPDDAGVGRPEDSDAPLEPGASPSLDEATTPVAEDARLPDGNASPEDAEAEDATGPVGAGVEALLDSEASVEPDGSTSPEDTEKPDAEEAARPDDSGVGTPDDPEIALDPDGSSPEGAAMEEAALADADDSARPDDVGSTTPEARLEPEGNIPEDAEMPDADDAAAPEDSGVGTPVDSEATLDPDGSTAPEDAGAPEAEGPADSLTPEDTPVGPPPTEVAPDAELSRTRALDEAPGNPLAEETGPEGWREPEADDAPDPELSGVGRLDTPPETEEPSTSLAEDGTPEGWTEPEADGAPEALPLSAEGVETDAELPACSLADDGTLEGCSEPEAEGAPEELGFPPGLFPLVLVNTGNEDWPSETEPEALREPAVADPALDVTPEDERGTMFRLTSISYVMPKEVSTMS